MFEKKSSIISVRVNEDVKRKLTIESELESLTMNTLISRILVRHVDWDKFAEDIGFVAVTKSFLRALLEALSDDKVKSIAVTTCRSAFKDAVIYTQGSLNLENLIKTLDLWFSSSHIPFRHIKKESSEKYIVQHELGEKWTIYFNALIGALLSDIHYKTANVVLTQQSVSFEIEKDLTKR